MSTTFDSIKRGMKQVIGYQKGKARGVKIHASSEIDVQALRKRIGLSQQAFAAKFSISLGTLGTGSAVIANLAAQNWCCCA